MPIYAANFHPRNNLKGINMLVLKGIQAGIQCIMIRNSDSVQFWTVLCNEVQQGINFRDAITGVGMHVKVCVSGFGFLMHMPILSVWYEQRYDVAEKNMKRKYCPTPSKY